MILNYKLRDEVFEFLVQNLEILITLKKMNNGFMCHPTPRRVHVVHTSIEIKFKIQI